MSGLWMSCRDSSFIVVRVSSLTIASTSRRIRSARADRSSRLPSGVATTWSMDGILLVDKPRGKTSHDVVDDVRRRTGERRAGPAGTLDPLATGLLVIALGKGLRLIEFMADHDKTYETDAELGILTETDDVDGPRIAERPVPARTE